jgi:hypothetical protein
MVMCPLSLASIALQHIVQPSNRFARPVPG